MPKKKIKSIYWGIDEQTHIRLKLLSVATGRTMRSMIKEYCEEGLKKEWRNLPKETKERLRALGDK